MYVCVAYGVCQSLLGKHGIRHGFAPPCESWKSNTGLQGEQPVLVNTESPPYYPFSNYY